MVAVLVHATAAPLEPYRVTVWTDDQGLPNRRVQALEQTHDGYLWIGTYHGLARFDGLRFAVFNDVNTPAMTSDNCTALVEDEAGALWVGTTDGLLVRRDGEFRALAVTRGMPEPEVRGLARAAGGGVWLGNARGLTRVREDKVESWTSREGLANDWVYCVDQAPDGAVWFSTAVGLQRLDPATGVVSQDLGGPGQSLAQGVQGVLAESKDRLWVYWKLGPELQLRHYEAGTWTQHPLVGPAEDLGYPVWLVKDRTGALWMPAGREGLHRFQDGVLTQLGRTEGLPDPWVLALHEGLDGSLWIGTHGGGLTRWRSGVIRTWTRQDGLAHDNCWAVTGDREGALWVASDGGVTRFLNSVARSFTDADGLPRNTVRALLAAADGAMWVGTGAGLCVIRGDEIEPQLLPGQLSESKVRALAQTADGRLWVATEGGLFRREESSWTHLTPREGLPHRDVRALLADRGGSLWVGTAGGGLARLAAGRWEVFGQAQGLASDVVWALHEGRDGTLWISTKRGLSWRTGDRFQSATANDGLLELAVNSVVEDQAGDLWLGGEKGIYRLQRADLEAFAAGRLQRLSPAAFGVVDGLRNNETNGQKCQPAAWCDPAGVVWFPTVAGLARIVPAEVQAAAVPPVVVIESVLAGEAASHRRDAAAGRRSAEQSGGEGLIAEGRSGVAEIRLAAGQHRALEIQYTAASFVSPELVRFRYQLEGEDTAWNEVGARRTAYYTSLRPGHYRFRVQACNSHGQWSQRDATLAITIEPFLTETVGFRVAGASAGVVLVLAGVHWRFRNRLRLERLERENALAEERSRIAKDLHDVVGANLTAVATHLELAGRAAGPTTPSTALTRARAVVDETARTMSEIIWSTDPRQDTLEATVNYLCRYADEFLEPAGIRCRFDLPTLLPAMTLPARLRHELLLTAREALTNIVKHAGATEVRLHLALGSAGLTLEIGDNGQGLPPGIPDGDGHGLTNMRRRIESIGGRLTIERPPVGGCRIRAEIPLTALTGSSSLAGRPLPP